MWSVYRCGKCDNCKNIKADEEPKDCLEKEYEYDGLSFTTIFGKKVIQRFKKEKKIKSTQ